MRLQRLFFAGLVLLLLLFTCGCGSGGTSSSPNGEPGRNKISLVSNTTTPALEIEADIPPMQVDQQVFIAISIFPTGGSTSAVSGVRTVEKATPVVTNATPVGTPGSTLVNAFGPNHSVFATATLETSPDIFSVAPTGPQTKPLDQERVEWDWFVTPRVSGEQRIGVDIEAQWTSTLSGKQSLPYTLGFPKFPVNVQAIPVVPTPTPTPPRLDPNIILQTGGTILGGIIGALGAIFAALLAIPSFRRWLRGRFGRAKEKPPNEPKPLPPS